MAQTIQFKRGTGVPVAVLAPGEPAYDIQNKVLYVGDGTNNNPISGGAGGAVVISGGTNSQSTGTVNFSAGNGVTFGLETNGVMTATVRTDYASSNHSHGNPTLNLTNLSGTTNSNSAGFTLSLSAANPVTTNGLLSAINVSAGAASANLSALTFSNGSGVSFGLTNGILTASVAAAAGQQTGISGMSAGTTQATSGTVSFSNASGVSWGMDGNTMTASVRTDYASSNHSHGNPTLALTNLSGTTASNSAGLTLSLSAAAQSTQPVAVSAANGSYAFSTLSFSNANGVSFGTSAGSALTASHNGLTSQSNQAFSAAGGSSAFQTLTFGNSFGVSFSNSGGSVVASIASTYAGTGFTSAGANISLSGTNNSNGLSLSASVAAQSVQPVAVSAANGSYAFSTLSFSNANGISFGTSAGSAVTASYTVPTITNSSWTVSDAGTSGTVGRLAFTNLNGVTLSLSTGAAGLHTIVGSHNGLTSQSNQAFSAGGGSSAFQTLAFGNSFGVSFSNSGGSVVGSIATTYAGTGFTSAGANIGLSGTLNTSGFSLSATVAAQTNQTLGLYAISNTTQGSSGTVDARSFSIQGAGVASVGFTNGSYVISVPAGGVALGTNTFGASNLGNTAGTSGVITGAAVQYVLAGGNNITLSQSILLSSATITISAANQSVQTQSLIAALYDGANSISTGTVFLSDANGFSFGINGQTVTGSFALNVNAGTTNTNQSFVEFDNSNGVSFGLNAGTITASVVPPLTLSSCEPWQAIGGSTSTYNSFVGTDCSVHLWPFTLGNYVSAGMLEMMMSCNFNTIGTSSGRQTAGFHVGLYTRPTNSNSSRLESLVSQSLSWQVTANNSTYSINQVTVTNYTGYGVTAQTSSAGSNITSGYTGHKKIIFPLNTLLSPGQYWLGLIGTGSSSSVSPGISLNPVCLVQAVNSGAAPMGSFSSAFTGGQNMFGGFWAGAGYGLVLNAATTALPNTIALSTIIQNNTNNKFPVFKFWST